MNSAVSSQFSNKLFHLLKTLLIHRSGGKAGSEAIHPQLQLQQNSCENLNLSTKVKSFSFRFVTFTCSLKIKVKPKSFPQKSSVDSGACGIPVLRPARLAGAEQRGAQAPHRGEGSLAMARPLAAVLTAQGSAKWVQCLPKENKSLHFLGKRTGDLHHHPSPSLRVAGTRDPCSALCADAQKHAGQA